MPLNNPDLLGPTLFVAASNASAWAKAHAWKVCDGSADNVEIQWAIDHLRI